MYKAGPVNGALILASHAKAAAAVGCENVGNRRVEIQAQELVSKGWRAVLWAAYAATTKGKPISRDKQVEITGVNPRTQRHYQLEGGLITARRNIAISDIPADQVTGLVEWGIRPTAFVWFDRKTGRKSVAWISPNSYTVAGMDAGPRGRSRKVNKSLRNILASKEALFSKQQGLTDYSPDIIRLFNRTQEQAKSTSRKLARQDNQPGEIFRLKDDLQSLTTWDVLPFSL